MNLKKNGFFGMKLFFIGMLGVVCSASTFSETVRIPIGKDQIAVVVQAQKGNNARLFAMYDGQKELFSMQIAPHLFERKGLGWEGVGSEWIFANKVDDVKFSKATNTVSARISATQNLPGHRPYYFRYEITVDPVRKSATLRFLDFAGLSQVPQKLLTIALPLKFKIRPSNRESSPKKMSFSYPNATFQTVLEGKNLSNGKLTHELHLTPPEILWLEKDVVWENFAPDIVWNIR